MEVISTTFKVFIVYDLLAYKGPLNGLYNVLESSGSEYNTVVAVDMPFIDLFVFATYFKKEVINEANRYDAFVLTHSIENIKVGPKGGKKSKETSGSKGVKEIKWEPLVGIYRKTVVLIIK